MCCCICLFTKILLRSVESKNDDYPGSLAHANIFGSEVDLWTC